MSNNDPLGVIHAGYFLLLQAARTRRDLYIINELVPAKASEKIAIWNRHKDFSASSFDLELEALELKLTMEALDAVEGKAE